MTRALFLLSLIAAFSVVVVSSPGRAVPAAQDDFELPDGDEPETEPEEEPEDVGEPDVLVGEPEAPPVKDPPKRPVVEPDEPPPDDAPPVRPRRTLGGDDTDAPDAETGRRRSILDDDGPSDSGRTPIERPITRIKDDESDNTLLYVGIGGVATVAAVAIVAGAAVGGYFLVTQLLPSGGTVVVTPH